MAYTYDVFLSYKKKPIFNKWIDNVFFELFEQYLEEALNRKVSIFKDTREIKDGQHWANTIKSALVHSRVLVPFFTPTYFQSEWCLREFSVIHERQKRLGFFNRENTSGLVIAVRMNDGDHFPPYANEIQMADWREYVLNSSYFLQSPDYMLFERQLIKWVLVVAEMINKAPDWEPEWSTPDWVESSFLKYPAVSLNSKMNPPQL